ncbi:hypothetical protein MXD63_24250 [Frankia sp. Cpl3]|nr:hypothetical protein [Frankia sp. Cpl3]
MSLWLNAGVPATEVARRARRSVDVLLRGVRELCGRAGRFGDDRTTDALTGYRPPADPGPTGDVTDSAGAGCEILDAHPAGTWRADSGEPDVA